MRQRSIQYDIYLRDADTNRELYNSLLQRYKEIGVAGSVEENNVAVINQPRLSGAPVSPRLTVNLFFAMLAGVVAAIAAAAVLNQVDETISDPEAVRGGLGLPLLGVCRWSRAAARRKRSMSRALHWWRDISRWKRAEACHGARRARSIAFTSTRPREGKSTSATALARLLAADGKRVVLIDADMRAPSLHNAFGVANNSGISNLLSGEQDIDRFVRPSGQEGLYVHCRRTAASQLGSLADGRWTA